MSTRSIARSLTPPALVEIYHRWSGHSLRFSGEPRDWHDAERMSAGYHVDEIVSRVLQATRAVVSGQAAFERDAVLFNEADYPFAILTGLLRAANGTPPQLDVIDFGGSLGSTYRQCRALLNRLAVINWLIVEQPAFVAAGVAEFETDELRFFASLAEVPPSDRPCAIVASSVLQYLRDPWTVLDEFAISRAGHLIIDRTPIGSQAEDRLCIQTVPRHIYAASYPCHILPRAKLMRRLGEHWRLVCEFPCAEGRANTDDGLAFEFRGLILERRQ